MPHRVSSKGQFVLPARLRRKYGIDPGEEVDVIDFGDEIVLVPVPKTRGRGMLSKRLDPVELLRRFRVRL